MVRSGFSSQSSGVRVEELDLEEPPKGVVLSSEAFVPVDSEDDLAAELVGLVVVAVLRFSAAALNPGGATSPTDCRGSSTVAYCLNLDWNGEAHVCAGRGALW